MNHRLETVLCAIGDGFNVPVCSRHLLVVSAFFGFGGTFAEKVLPDTSVGLGGVLLGLVALIGAAAKFRNDGAESRRKDRILEAKLKAMQEKTENNLGTVSRRQDLFERGIKHVRQKQVKIEQTIKGMEELTKIGLTEPMPPPTMAGPTGVVPPSDSVLIVDDNPLWINTLGCFFIRNLGPFNLLQAPDMKTAMSEIKRAPKWIFLDLRLGDHSGLELVPLAKSYNPDVKILVITEDHDEEEKANAVMLGVDIWMKPVSRKQMTHLVMMMIDDFGSSSPSSDEIPVDLSASLVPGIPPGTDAGVTSA